MNFRGGQFARESCVAAGRTKVDADGTNVLVKFESVVIWCKLRAQFLLRDELT